MTVANKRNKEIRQKLLSWYQRNKRDLPWRKNTDPWRVWVSEIMLQQTTVDTVIPYYLKFLKRFPQPKSLAAAQEKTALKFWEGLGYYTRIRNLKKAATLVTKNGFPQSREDWQKLPGLGPYSSAAIASIVNNEAASVVDGNVFRVLSRLNKDKTAIDDSSSREYYENIANSLISKRSPGNFNQALMELGATVCKPHLALCKTCPLEKLCRGKKQWKALPIKNKKNKSSAIKVVAALIRRKDGKYLLDLRSDKVVMGGLWEFPGGKIEKNEKAEEALHREIKEEVGIRIKIIQALPIVKHAYTRFRVTLIPFLCEYVSGQARVNDTALAEVKWFAPKEWKTLSMPAGSRKILKALPKSVKL